MPSFPGHRVDASVGRTTQPCRASRVDVTTAVHRGASA